MPLFELKMPKLGESITEGTIMSWSVKVGDTIKEDQILFEVNTAKVSAEIPSPVEGKIIAILFNEDDTVAVGTVVATIQLDGDEAEYSPQALVEDKQEANTPHDLEKQTAAPLSNNAARTEEARWYSPLVLQLAETAKISKEELDSVLGTGYLGRLSKKDIQHYIDKKGKGTAIAPPSPIPKQQASTATEATKTLAPVVIAGGDEVIEMDRVRRIIADHMVMSKKVSPHVTTVLEVDVTKLVQWRTRNKDAFARREGVALTYMPAIVEATAKALAKYPMVNSSVNGYQIILRKHINMGVAVSLNDGNLIVPVIPDADRLSISGLALSIDALTTKARDNKLTANDIQGGTFTITNFGSFKSLFGTPIINQPQAAILGVGFIEKKPAVLSTPEGDSIAIRHKMYLSLSYDHRVIDGSLGGNFLRYIADYLENWNA